MDEKVMLSVNEVMRKMGIGRDRAYEIMKSGEFKTHKVGRRYLVHQQVFENWLVGGKDSVSRK